MHRRSFLLGTTAALAACRFTSARTRWRDAIVVGGGLAGLSAALELERRGVDVQLVEAQPRLGGRVDTEVRDGVVLGERGAQFITPDMRRMLALVRDEGVSFRALASPRRTVAVSARGVEALPDGAGMLQALLASGLDAAATMEKDATVASVLGAAGPLAPVARSQLMELLGRAPEEVSLAAAMEVVRRNDALESDGQLMVTGGLHRVVSALAAGLRRPPRLNVPVRSVRWAGGEVEISTGNETVRAARAVLAVPPTVLSAIVFEPALPGHLVEALSAYRAGRMVKTTLRFERPFWRRGEVPEDAVFTDVPGLVTVDAGDDGGAVLVAFAGAEAALELSRHADRPGRVNRLAELLAPLALPGRKVPPPVAAVDGVWVDHPYSGGGYNSWVRSGGPIDAAERLRAGVGPLVFTSSELATSSPGYMEGALQAGVDAADRLAG